MDSTGGVGDSMALAIAHAEGGRVVLDLVREWRSPLSPAATVAECAALLPPYRVTTVHGDRYSEELIREHFRAHGITYQVSDRAKSDLYVELVPLLTSQQAYLLDDPRLLAQLLSLERRTGRSGKDSIDHPRHSLDDVANAAAGALVLAARRGVQMFQDLADQVAAQAATGPLPEPRRWVCPRCGWERLTADREPRCLQCHPRGPTWEDLRHL